jgi:hypothetical protein
VPYRTLHRFGVTRCGFGRRRPTVRVANGEPGVECQLDFGRLGLVPDPETGRRRVAHALIFTAVYGLRQLTPALLDTADAACTRDEHPEHPGRAAAPRPAV